MDEQGEYAVLSKAAYDLYYGDADAANRELQAFGLPYKIDEQHSDKDSVTILRPGKQPVVAYRGTDFTSPRDLLADLQILAGVHSTPLMWPANPMNRFENAHRRYEQVKAVHGEPILTGHSLGGAQALHVARRNGGDAVVFNPGSSPLAEPFHSLFTSDKPQKVYTTGDDLISYSSFLGRDNIVLVPRKDREQYLSHSLINFLPPRQLPFDPLPYLAPVHRETMQRVRFCEIYPDLCGRRR